MRIVPLPLLLIRLLIAAAAAASATTSLITSASHNFYSLELPDNEHGKCEKINVEYCIFTNYNQTRMPNILNHENQEKASHELQKLKFVAISKSNCSQDLRLFLCLVYIPVCTFLDEITQPCRSLCTAVQNGCTASMKQFGSDWPEELDCSRFPDNTSNCFGKNESYLSHSDPESILGPGSDTKSQKFAKKSKWASGSSSSAATAAVSAEILAQKNGLKSGNARDFGFVCPLQLKVPKSLDYAIRVGNRLEPDCGVPCNDLFFDDTERNFARIWIACWSFICLLSCFFTLITFLIDTERFQYPERPIIFLTLCYFMISGTYIYGFFAGNESACQRPFVQNQTVGVQPVSVISQGTKTESCTILFMILYFFGMSSSVWWVILTLTWFLAAGLKWGHEAIEANSHYFHLAAWAIPAIKTIVVLSIGRIEGDVLSGVCYVGLLNVDTLRSFVLVPLVIYLILGTIFLLAGFVSLFRIRKVMKHDGTKTDKLEKLMIRILIFSSLYTIPAFVIIACLFYEQMYVDSWMLTWHAKICENVTYSIPCPIRDQKLAKIGYKPIFEVYMLKYLMSIIVGVTSTVWIWSGKTVHSWRKMYQRCFANKTINYV